MQKAGSELLALRRPGRESHDNKASVGREVDQPGIPAGFVQIEMTVFSKQSKSPIMQKAARRDKARLQTDLVCPPPTCLWALKLGDSQGKKTKQKLSCSEFDVIWQPRTSACMIPDDTATMQCLHAFITHA